MLKEKIVKLKAKYNETYKSYGFRLAFFLLLMIILLFLGLVSITGSLTYLNKKAVNYSEIGKVNYKVYLKDNDFYESDYLEKGMSYVTSLIKNVEIDYSYNLDLSDYTNIVLTHQVVGKLQILDESGNNLFYEKEYVLDEPIADTITNKNYKINKVITIDYDYYNNIANQFKSTYGVNTKSNFIVYLKLNKISSDNDANNKSSDMSLTIPLSMKSINISIDSKEINNNGKLSIDYNKVEINSFKMLIGIILCLGSIVCFIKVLSLLFKLNKKKTTYDKLLSKILREYDRLVVTTDSIPDFIKFNVIKIKSFDELLDARDNLKQPIMYYNIREHEKCYFYILHHTNLYLLLLKSVDLENNDEKV